MGGFDYPNEFTYEADLIPEMMETGAFAIIGVVYLAFFLFALALSVIPYVLHSIGCHTIAKRRGIRHAWLAWLPIGEAWILGSISDQYQYVTKGKVKNHRKLLTGLYIGFFALYIGWLVMAIMGMLLGDSVAEATVMGILLFVLSSFLAAAIAIILAVYRYICLYDLYASCDPDNAVLFLVLSIVFSVAMPFFVFASRNKDIGMPPRRRQPVCEAEEIPEPAVIQEGYAQPEDFDE